MSLKFALQFPDNFVCRGATWQVSKAISQCPLLINHASASTEGCAHNFADVTQEQGGWLEKFSRDSLYFLSVFSLTVIFCWPLVPVGHPFLLVTDTFDFFLSIITCWMKVHHLVCQLEEHKLRHEGNWAKFLGQITA